MKVLITANFTEEGKRRLESMGLEVVHEPWTSRSKLLLSEELAERVNEVGADAAIIEVDLCHEEVFEECSLRFVGCCRGDPITVDLEEATDAGVPVLFTPGRNADAVADLTVGFMLCHLRKIIDLNASLKSGRFNPETPAEYMKLFHDLSGLEIGGLKIGIVGLGAVGSAVARRLVPFGPRLAAFDPFADKERFRSAAAEKVELAELFAESDVVTIHAADVDENRGMIGRELIDSMKPGAFFLNLARSWLTDQDALYDALSQGRIGGAALDVFEDEPPSSEDRFVRLPNVIVTPHFGGNTRDVVRHQTDMIVADVEALLSGKRPRFVANPEALDL